MNLETLSKGFVKAPAATIMGLLVLGIIYLAIENKSIQAQKSKVEADAAITIVNTERRCAEEKDEFRKQLIEAYRSMMEYQSVLDMEVKKLKRKK